MKNVFCFVRWYDVSYEYGKPLLWGRHLGCDFVYQSCKQWIDTKLVKFVHHITHSLSICDYF